MNLLKDSHEQYLTNGKALYLSDLGMHNWAADKYRTPNGGSMYVKIGNREG